MSDFTSYELQALNLTSAHIAAFRGIRVYAHASCFSIGGSFAVSKQPPFVGVKNNLCSVLS